MFDPMGHGLASALIAALCVGSYRHDRREGQTLDQVHAHLDSVVGREFPNQFATGQLARIDLNTGEMRWMNAAHPLPMLLRGGRVIGELQCAPTLPWGMGALSDGETPPAVETEALEPGDSVLFYTDGVVEAHVPGGEEFGPERLADLAGQHASDLLDPEEVVRRLVRAVVEHQDQRLADDATMVLMQWHGPRG